MLVLETSTKLLLVDTGTDISDSILGYVLLVLGVVVLVQSTSTKLLLVDTGTEISESVLIMDCLYCQSCY